MFYFTENNDKVLELLRGSLNDLNFHNVALKNKLNIQIRRKELVTSRTEFQRVLDAVRNMLVYVEQELSKQITHNVWLTGDEFTVADVSLGLLLQRLYQLGFEDYYWSNDKLPQVERYFQRFRQRASYLKVMPSSNFEILKDMWSMTPTNYKLIYFELQTAHSDRIVGQGQ